jgi:hypothetical protein
MFVHLPCLPACGYTVLFACFLFISVCIYVSLSVCLCQTEQLEEHREREIQKTRWSEVRKEQTDGQIDK